MSISGSDPFDVDAFTTDPFDAGAPGVIEHAFMCPYCWETITMLLDASAAAQCYIEDCEVCCNPIEIEFQLHGDAVVAFDAHPP